jgi:hypothetical protein
LSKDFENLARNVEENLNCNGICSPGIFYYFKTLDNGPPKASCLSGIKKEFFSTFNSKPLGIGILLIISFVLTLLTHITAWTMCCKCCSPKERKNDD